MQFEATLRAGLVFSSIDLAGLGERFHARIQSLDLQQASVFLIVIVLLTSVFDRTPRGLRIGADSAYGAFLRGPLLSSRA